MIVGIFGKDVAIRKNGARYVRELGAVSDFLYDNTFSTDEIKKLVESQSLFGDIKIVYAENVIPKIDKEEREEIFALCKESKNVFIFDELEEDTEVKKILLKVSDHFFDASSPKKQREFPSALCNALLRRDKKTAWIEYLKVRKMDAEPLHGAVLWQMKEIWKSVMAGKKTAYSKDEIVEKNRELVIMFHEAHRGVKDFKREMERWVLSL